MPCPCGVTMARRSSRACRVRQQLRVRSTPPLSRKPKWRCPSRARTPLRRWDRRKLLRRPFRRVWASRARRQHPLIQRQLMDRMPKRPRDCLERSRRRRGHRSLMSSSRPRRQHPLIQRQLMDRMPKRPRDCLERSRRRRGHRSLMSSSRGTASSGRAAGAAVTGV